MKDVGSSVLLVVVIGGGGGGGGIEKGDLLNKGGGFEVGRGRRSNELEGGRGELVLLVGVGDFGAVGAG